MQTKNLILRKKIVTLVSIALVISLFSCARKGGDYMQTEQLKDSVAASLVSSSASVENNKDSVHKFIRTADLKFKVKSVIRSTYDIEDITARQGGFVTYTNLSSNIDGVTTIAISADSSVERTYFTVSNSIVLRVPNIRLDTTLKEIAKNIDYLDYRIIKADDVALQLLANNLTLKRTSKNEQRLTNAIDQRGKKLKETTTAEELLLNKQEQADNAKVSNLALMDQINFSTIKLEIYQRQTVKQERIANDKDIPEYKQGFGSEMLDSLKFGWNIIKAVFIFFLKFWAIFLFGIVVYIIYRIIEHKRKK